MLSTSVPASLEASGSFVLSLASFLTNNAQVYPESVLVTESKQQDKGASTAGAIRPAS